MQVKFHSFLVGIFLENNHGFLGAWDCLMSENGSAQWPQQ